MRHLLANIATYAIALFLLTGAGIFAWMRSAQITYTTESTVLASYEPRDTGTFRWEALGRSSYRRNCMNCHGAQGQGWDQYPPLTSAATVAEEPGGREYLIDLHLYGLTSRRWRAPMPPMGHLHDVELAAVMNYVLTSFEGADRRAIAPLLLPDDIRARRGQRLSPGDVNRRRPGGDRQ